MSYIDYSLKGERKFVVKDEFWEIEDLVNQYSSYKFGDLNFSGIYMLHDYRESGYGSYGTKIGKASNIGRRLRNYQTGWPDYKMVGLIIKTRHYDQVEKIIHEYLKECKSWKRGEWFDICNLNCYGCNYGCNIEWMKDWFTSIKHYYNFDDLVFMHFRIDINLDYLK
jgi:hypothetical protein